jgi:hypothetical protein
MHPPENGPTKMASPRIFLFLTEAPIRNIEKDGVKKNGPTKMASLCFLVLNRGPRLKRNESWGYNDGVKKHGPTKMASP